MGSSIYAERCHCGCDKLSHYRDPASGVREACLNARCDCKKYVNEFATLPPPPKVRRKGHPDTCRCADCPPPMAPDADDHDTDPYIYLGV